MMASNSENWVDESENEYGKTYAILFVIEVSPSMMEPISDVDPCSLQTALICAYQLAAQKVISTPNDLIGVLLFGTEEATGNAENEYVILPMDMPDSNRLKHLKHYANDFDSVKQSLRPSSNPPSLSHALYSASIMLTTTKNIGQRLFLITDNDTPAWDSSQKNALMQRAKDLKDMNIDLCPIFLDSPAHSFNVSNFYREFLSIASRNHETIPQVQRGQEQLNNMLHAVRALQKPRRAQFHFNMELSDNVKINVEGFAIFRRLVPTKTTWVYTKGEQFAIAVPQSTQVSFETKRVLKKDEIKRAYMFGGKQVVFSQDELSKIRYFGGPVLRIIGFRPLTTYKSWMNVKPSLFIRAKSIDIKGSELVFSALHAKLLRDNLLGIGWFIAEQKATPCFVAIIATPTSTAVLDDFVLPQGFFLIQLPTADDIRTVPPRTKAKPDNTLLSGFKQIVRGIELRSFYPGKYSNIALQWHYTILQALALDEPVPSQLVDTTLPKYAAIEKRVGPFIKQVNGAANRISRAHTSPKAETQETVAASEPREIRSSSSAPKAKRIRTQKSNFDYSDDTVLKSLSDSDMLADSLKGLKVVNLKEIAKRHGIPTSGKKSMLIEAICRYFTGY
ncbi:Ku domain-containing protein Pku70 [Schizosaccharomyces japonicus yFS275]|uniref:ATP-dependent DNA helicase II subunit 1 n=1 Tax=Schizosaccharomyces japonicus (strain yFS275 / FY16936) TaxID=402676 RepID=T0S376_SCHJY|nr:Ku domain-containing protein Pku70 [Schizosaccharomyces japonicus yFS275]EQC53076.1 Ku domain-containing protein Pku70 [Schizosaccharomyces japonicus yFS275]